MTLDEKVNLILVITGVLLVSQLVRDWNEMSREYRKSEIESMRLLIPLGGTIGFTWAFLSGSKDVWMPWAAIISLVALIYGVVRVARKRPDE
jgi:hypothetical protein